jgi:hypothetical protein
MKPTRKEFKLLMKCCGSPTTFIGVSRPDTRPAADNVLQAVLFSEIFKPLAKTLGPVGDITIEAVAQHLFVQPRS